MGFLLDFNFYDLASNDLASLSTLIRLAMNRGINVSGLVQLITQFLCSQAALTCVPLYKSLKFQSVSFEKHQEYSLVKVLSLASPRT